MSDLFDYYGSDYYYDLGHPFAAFDDYFDRLCQICEDVISIQDGGYCPRCLPFKAEYEAYILGSGDGAFLQDLEEVDFDELARTSYPIEYQQAWLEELMEVPRSTTTLNAVIRCRFGVGV